MGRAPRLGELALVVGQLHAPAAEEVVEQLEVVHGDVRDDRMITAAVDPRADTAVGLEPDAHDIGGVASSVSGCAASAWPTWSPNTDPRP
jgi:hypothetical protein